MNTKDSTSSNPSSLTGAVTAIDRALEASFRARIDAKAKPPGSLGRIEDLAVQLGMIWHPHAPRAGRAALLIFAGDHGLTKDGVSQYPSSVTAAMVTTFLAGRASANAFASACDVDVHVVDAGVAADLEPHPRLIAAKIAHGTANAAVEPAMSKQAAVGAIARGRDIAVDVIRGGADIVAIGEMGIGNTASSALIMHRLAPAPLDDCVGRGAGHDDAGMARKRATLQRAASRVSVTEPLQVMAEFGGFEIAMMAGAVIGAAAERRPVIIDGFIASAAALAAVRLCPEARDYCVFAHRSAERGHRLLLQSLDANPLLDLDLRLGEGTGAVLAVPLLRSAARLLTDVADLADLLPGAD
jgi:nicotinate-nucleotide--dimethylbenzimidazole phosphoribosyltransferase